MTEFNFEVFDKRGGRLAKVPELTIQSKGAMSLNASAYHMLGEPEAVELLFDREQRVIGIRGVPVKTPHAYGIRGVGKSRGSGVNSGTSFVISSKAFFDYYGVPLGRPVRREVQVHDGVLIVDLKDPGRDATSNRNLKKRQSEAVSGSGDHETTAPTHLKEVQ